MNILHSIHVRTGTAAANYLDTQLTAYGRVNDFARSSSTTAAALGCPAFAALAAWLLGDAQAGGWKLRSAIVEPAGEVPTGVGTATRRAFAIALTPTKDGGETTRDLNSESMPDAARDALPALWDAMAAFLATWQPQ